MSLYEEYAVLESEYRKLEKAREELRGRILADLIALSKDKIEMAFGLFTVGRKFIYSYSQKIHDLEDKVKITKMREEDKGTAKAKEITYLIYSAKKL